MSDNTSAMSLATTTVVRRYRFPGLPVEMLARISEGRSESAKVWEYCRDLHANSVPLGRDKCYLAQKLGRLGIVSFTGSERGTSSRCPQCGHKHKPKRRQWHCKKCGFTGHRDLVGSVNMYEDNFTKLTEFPALVAVTYLRPRTHSLALKENEAPGSSSLDTGRRARNSSV